jgi:hypothetical protein
VLPPVLITIGKGLLRKLGFAEIVRSLKEARDIRAYLSRTGSDEVPVQRWRLRDLVARLELNVPPEAFSPSSITSSRWSSRSGTPMS